MPHFLTQFPHVLLDRFILSRRLCPPTNLLAFIRPSFEPCHSRGNISIQGEYMRLLFEAAATLAYLRDRTVLARFFEPVPTHLIYPKLMFVFYFPLNYDSLSAFKASHASFLCCGAAIQFKSTMAAVDFTFIRPSYMICVVCILYLFRSPYNLELPKTRVLVASCTDPKLETRLDRRLSWLPYSLARRSKYFWKVDLACIQLIICLQTVACIPSSLPSSLTVELLDYTSDQTPPLPPALPATQNLPVWLIYKAGLVWPPLEFFDQVLITSSTSISCAAGARYL
ncbi:hypothetical protein B0H11DRAFT_1921591 [Mycena galericulata]|nr:hypothetical protein B0H11DRAFT_1921591 [Mycena galericulata]